MVKVKRRKGTEYEEIHGRQIGRNVPLEINGSEEVNAMGIILNGRKGKIKKEIYGYETKYLDTRINPCGG